MHAFMLDRRSVTDLKYEFEVNVQKLILADVKVLLYGKLKLLVWAEATCWTDAIKLFKRK